MSVRRDTGLPRAPTVTWNVAIRAGKRKALPKTPLGRLQEWLEKLETDRGREGDGPQSVGNDPSV
jgi:hypothetical protein